MMSETAKTTPQKISTISICASPLQTNEPADDGNNRRANRKNAQRRDHAGERFRFGHREAFQWRR